MSAVTPRHHGFTCPNCGSHFFGTSSAPPGRGKGTGHCNANAHNGNGCTFSWDRNDPVAEAQAIYQQTPEEWKASFEAFKDTAKRVKESLSSK